MRLSPVRYGSSTDIQLWNVTDLAVQFRAVAAPETVTARRHCAIAWVLFALVGCGGRADESGRTVITISSSVVGTDGPLLRRQLDRFMRLNPDIDVRLHRVSDDANQRHQLYVQWLNARVGNPDMLQLDVVWTPEFAAAGWVLPLEGTHRRHDGILSRYARGEHVGGQAVRAAVVRGRRTAVSSHRSRSARAQTLEELADSAQRAVPAGPRRMESSGRAHATRG